ncbi:PREDICTED: prostate and testis expressed protein 1-like [Chrysochloris asiatica]|uniref:Prostate and testis expressed protein 1-like n=1 Tax=Chrysochloris asiatica TaxID=185453 RepID=A0A9B0UC14_CHRAS|nr:PREDICTED: prostate and testis expressed protein 1-like [Chrysochloris asiatica]
MTRKDEQHLTRLAVSVMKAEFAETVQCRMCYLQFPGEECSRGRGICNADTNEACVVGKMYKKIGLTYDLWLTFKGCQKNCADADNIKWNIYTVEFSCCRDSHLCNENL